MGNCFIDSPLYDKLRSESKPQGGRGFISDLWFTLPRSENDGDAVLGPAWYLDDSGSNDGSPLVTCGGLSMTRINFTTFSQRWDKMFARYRNTFSGYVLEPPLHMNDFTGNNKYAGLRPEFKRTLFLDAAKIINAHKLYSMSIAVPQRAFSSELSENVRRVLIGPYAFAFMAFILGHRYVSEHRKEGPIKAAYMVDCGFGHYDQLVEVHRVILGLEMGIDEAFGRFRHTGALGQDSDDRVPPLQAADAIAWASRKMELNGTLPEGFEPLSEIVREDLPSPIHATIRVAFRDIEMLTAPINKWIDKYGRLPGLADILVHRVGAFAIKLKR